MKTFKFMSPAPVHRSLDITVEKDELKDFLNDNQLDPIQLRETYRPKVRVLREEHNKIYKTLPEQEYRNREMHILLWEIFVQNLTSIYFDNELAKDARLSAKLGL